MPAPETMEDLAPQQYSDMYQEPDAPLSDVRGSALRLVLYVGAGLLILFTTLAAVITIPRHLRFPFVLKGSTREKIYRFPDNVYIDARYVMPGEHVRRGGRLLAITSPRIASLIAAYNDALRRRELFAQSELAAYDARIDEARLEAKRLGVEIAQAEEERTYGKRKGESELRALAADAEHARKVYESQRQLHASGSTADLELKGAEARSIAASERLREAETRLMGEERALTSKARQLALDRDRASQTMAALDAEKRGRGATLDSDVESAAAAIELNYGPFRIDGGGLELLAPAEGVVSFVFDGERELPAGAILIKLKGSDSALYAAAQVPPELIGFIHAGAAAALEVTTFPHYHWGALRGSVTSVSLTPDEKGGYPLQVTIADAGKMGGKLGSGMTGEMSVAVEERTLFDILFEKIDEAWPD
jgi:HlyD family secretion protein